MLNRQKMLYQFLVATCILGYSFEKTFAEEMLDVDIEDAEDEQAIAERAALYTDRSIDAQTSVFLRDIKRFLHGNGGEISDLVHRGKKLADRHFSDGEYIIGRELDDLVEIVSLGEMATPECWETVDTLMDLPH
ncbi:MAG: hypothetical protein LBH38_02310 [Holosporales bacterium]|jgi:hypothetical protein|nr:hypothetical protein [Holosporales bacterium]